MSYVLLYVTAVVLAAWAGAHLIKTREVVNGLHPHDLDARRVITMEWIGEGLTLLFVAALVVAVAVLGQGRMGSTVLVLVAVLLNVMSSVSLVTGFRVDFIAYRLCPVIFTGSSVLVVAALLV